MCDKTLLPALRIHRRRKYINPRTGIALVIPAVVHGEDLVPVGNRLIDADGVSGVVERRATRKREVIAVCESRNIRQRQIREHVLRYLREHGRRNLVIREGISAGYSIDGARGGGIEDLPLVNGL